MDDLTKVQTDLGKRLDKMYSKYFNSIIPVSDDLKSICHNALCPILMLTANVILNIKNQASEPESVPMMKIIEGVKMSLIGIIENIEICRSNENDKEIH